MNKSDKIYVAGHNGMAGSAFVRALKKEGYSNLLLVNRKELDLLDQRQTTDFFQTEKPDHVILAAAKVGGILANNEYRAEFIYENIVIEANVIDSAYRSGVDKLLFLGSACIYPRMAPQPMSEKCLLTGPLEPTNEPYAIAKIAGVKMVEAYNSQYGMNFTSVMPNNLYGPKDNFDLKTSHVLPALIRKFHEAKLNGDPSVTVWGTGSPCREFLHVDDMAYASLYLMQENYKGLINIGSGEEVTIAELAGYVKEVTGYEGEIVFDKSKPDGTPRKLLDLTKLNEMGWRSSIKLKDGIASTYEWYVAQPVV